MELNRLLLVLSILFGVVLISTTSLTDAQETANSTSKIQNIVYTTKFVCGSIPDNNGPIRPGYYDTSLNILNKKNYRVGFVWTAIINDGPTSNAIYKNLDPENSTGMSCKDIKDVFGIDTRNLLEGFVMLKVPLSSLKGLINEEITSYYTLQDPINVLDVQAFYTANALPTLPHEVAQEKISFYIVRDGTGKIPEEFFRKPFDMTIPSMLNEIQDTEQKVKTEIGKKFALDKKEIGKIGIRITDISIEVGATPDDHAISLYVATPDLGP